MWCVVRQVGLYCPKVAIMMEGWATDAKPAQFEVAAQELSAKYHSGMQSVGHGQAGPGSMSLQVLHESHTPCLFGPWK